MDHFAGLDVSVKETSICIVDDAARTALLSCAARKGSIRTSTTVGRRSSWRGQEGLAGDRLRAQ